MIDIRIAEPIPTRPCHFMLGMQDDCVFADFDIDENGCLYLVRISYDGYGCCSLESDIQIGKIDKEKSTFFINKIEARELKDPQLIKILSSYLNENKKLLWEDALTDHALI